MTTGEKIRTRRKELGISVDELADRLGKNRATIYRYESDAIEMPASMLKPLADTLDTTPDYLMSWETLLTYEADRNDKICEILPLIADGLSIEGRNQKYIICKAPALGGNLQNDFHDVLMSLYQFNLHGQDVKMQAMRVLTELVSSLDVRSQEKLISYAEFLDTQSQKRYGSSITHPYKRE